MMRCPICKNEIDASQDNRFRPFCSERCQLIDLGSWAGERYRVPAESQEESKRTPDDRHDDSAGAGRSEKQDH